MKKKYISFDIEASGPTPGKYSMLSLGACVVGEKEKQFYVEIKPISKNFDRGAMQVGCLGLKCLKPYENDPKLNPKGKDFDPKKALDILEKEGVSPEIAVRKYAEWIREVTKGFTPVQAAAPIIFDGMFVNWYFDNFLKENPFGHSGEDISSLYRGLKKDVSEHLANLGLRPKELPHNALGDAIIQATEMEEVLRLMKST